jgi:hypothetical protein
VQGNPLDFAQGNLRWIFCAGKSVGFCAPGIPLHMTSRAPASVGMKLSVCKGVTERYRRRYIVKFFTNQPNNLTMYGYLSHTSSFFPPIILILIFSFRREKKEQPACACD